MEYLRNKAFIYIIESPRDTDLLDGRTEGRALVSALELADIQCYYSLVTTANSLEIALNQRLFQAIAETDKFPILHFSMHGDNRGIELTNENFVQWHQLFRFIAPIQKFLGEFSLDLLVCMSSCYGSFAREMATVKKGNIPFKYLVGNSDSVPWNDAAVAYITFYHLLFKGLNNLDECRKVMMEASGNNLFELHDGEQINLNWFTSNQRLLSVRARAKELAQNYINRQR